uniref:NADH-ubiquinone oxidoreductase chain 5 n=1 Tax=Coleoptera sp. ACP-2013 TaxID=2485033 RepID=A0A3G3ME67_9COLE|nr:NADH dehydrogenase subunit 5 [Coleoptera sp. ACP-2013]
MISICLIFFCLFFLSSSMFFIFSLKYLINDYTCIIEYKFLEINSSMIEMVILIDWMSLLFMSFVLYISSMVIYYSEEYMFGDFNMKRFILLVVLFVFSMMFMIISPNIISILLGWDGLGLVSYCLVIYYQNVKSYSAGMLTALTNRIGDVALLLSIAWMLSYGSWNYIFYLEFMKVDYSMSWIALLVILAAMTKSAQIPFSSWLPAAMAAPTPVSSLVHSSTLVTAGVYLLIRFSNLIGENIYLLFFGSMTMFMAGLGANFEFDLKKIIALSTLSQLGFMMSILAMGDYKLSFFHLLSHALFKATLFMCAGCIIHSVMNCQDIRFLGCLIKQFPLTCIFFNISNLSLCGIPFLSGFYSKDLILEALSMNFLSLYIYVIFFISTGLTVSYSFRLLYYSILGNFNFLSINNINDQGKIMLKSMMGLIFLVVMGGSLLMWIMFSTPYFICLPFLMKMMVIIVTMFGIWLGLEFSLFNLTFNLKSMFFLKLSYFLANMWNMPMLSTISLNKSSLIMGKLYYFYIDQGWSEYFGSQKIYTSMNKISLFSQYIYMNNLKNYFFMMVIFSLLILLTI